MQLTITKHPVTSMEWGSDNIYRDGLLQINKNKLLSILEKSKYLENFEVCSMDIVYPDSETRVINVFDIIPAYSRSYEKACNYPGFVDSIESVGDGSSSFLENFSILAISSIPGRYNKVLDKSGVGADLTPYSKHFNLAIQVKPKHDDMSMEEYYNGIKKISLKLGAILASDIISDKLSKSNIYSIEPKSHGLPKVVYVCMLAALQNWNKSEEILYGDSLDGFLPTILHPNEILDGAIIAQNFNLGIDTYSFVSNSIIQELYERHGKEIDFCGVIVTASHVTRSKRERSILMTVNLTANVLEADLALLTKVGGGIPESDIMLTIESLENKGIKTSAVMWAHLGDGSIKDVLSAYSPSADALVCVGINDEWINLPKQKTVIGGNFIDATSDDPLSEPQDAHSIIKVRYRDICGAINQLGASKVSLVEI